MKQRGLKLLGVITAVVAAGFVFHALAFHSLTGHWFPQTIDEPLHNPVAVSRLSNAGIILTDGSVVSLPDIDKVPVNLQALVDSVEDGVEVDHDGEVWGRIKLHRWCGNDPVRKHIARVNLTDLILAYRTLHPDEQTRFYGEHGLRTNHYSSLGWIQTDRYLKKIQASHY